MIDEGITEERQLTKGHWRGQSDPSVQGIEEPENHSEHIQNRKAAGRSGGDSVMLSIVELYCRNKARALSIGCFLFGYLLRLFLLNPPIDRREH